MISFERIVRCACKVSPLSAASYAIVWSIGRIATGMISGMSRLINNLREEFLLVLSVSVTFLFFPSLVRVDNFGSLYGSISASSFSEFIICRIVDCWLNHQSIKYFYHFCQNVWRNSLLICRVCDLSLCIGCDRGLMTESIHGHIIGINFSVLFFILRFCHEFTDCLSEILIGQWCIVTIIVIN